MYYYGFDNSCGVGTRSAFEPSKRMGVLHVFSTRAARDSWVASETVSGRRRREALTASEARPYLIDAACAYRQYSPLARYNTKADVAASGVSWMVSVISEGIHRREELEGADGIERRVSAYVHD